MEEIIELIEKFGPGGAVIIVLLGLAAIFGCYAAFCKGKDILEKYHQSRRKVEKRDEEINSRFKAIEESQAEDHKQLMNLKRDLDDVRKLIEKIQDTQDKNNEIQRRANRAQSRSAMMRLTNELLTQGYMSEAESETLDDLVDVFMQSGGENDTRTLPNIVSRALKLTILTADEIKQQQNINNKGEIH